MHRADGAWHPVPSEGGHADFAARTDEEIELLRWLRDRFGPSDRESTSVVMRRRAEERDVGLAAGTIAAHHMTYTLAYSKARRRYCGEEPDDWAEPDEEGEGS